MQIRASQHLVSYEMVLLIINLKGYVADQHPSNKVLLLANILGGRTFSALGYIKDDPIAFGQ